ncbi:MAG TPA: thermonuclease family protein [Gallionella sp.]|nr:thermonuclease family protein [Gallionella sp.]
MTSCLRCLLCVLLLLAGGFAEAAEFSGKVIAVLDGDTLLVLRSGSPVKVRLAEVDAPEKAQPYGTASQKSLAEMVMGKQVRLAVRAVDNYGRLVATVQADGVNVNHEQVRRGMAWEYSRFHSNHEVMALQREAQQARRGLWAGEGAIEPSLWRKQHPAVVPAAATTPGTLCGSKKHCSQISSCEEARHYLTQCGIKTLDGNGDGVPCENLCGGKK